jgi:hypothetical protein
MKAAEHSGLFVDVETADVGLDVGSRTNEPTIGGFPGYYFSFEQLLVFDGGEEFGLGGAGGEGVDAGGHLLGGGLGEHGVEVGELDGHLLTRPMDVGELLAEVGFVAFDGLDLGVLAVCFDLSFG